jgi:hypothetical protein
MDYIGVYYLRGKKTSIEIRQVRIICNHNIPYLEIF